MELSPNARHAYSCNSRLYLRVFAQVLKKKVADDRPDDSYMFEMDFDVSVENVIDAKYYGNVARFINHSVSRDFFSFGALSSWF